MKPRATLDEAEKQFLLQRAKLDQSYTQWKTELKAASTSKKSFLLMGLTGAVLGYFSGSGSLVNRVKRKASAGVALNWMSSFGKILLPYMTGTILGAVQGFFSRRADQHEEGSAQPPNK